MPRSPAHYDVLMRRLGSDLLLVYGGPSGTWEDGDLDTHGRSHIKDVRVARELDAADQMLVNRLKTHRGELAPLGHPNYGSRHHELIGEPNVQRTRQLIKLYVLEALSEEPRIAKVLRCDVKADSPPRDTVRIEIELLLIEEHNPRNLVIPFVLESSV